MELQNDPNGKKITLGELAQIVSKGYNINPKELYNVYKQADKKYEVYSHFDHVHKVKGTLLATYNRNTNELYFLA